MSKVIIAEKPSVAKNIADAVSSTQRKDGYYEGPEYLVTWAFGHLLELYDAKEYDEKMKTWRMDYYPFIPEQFLYRIKNASGRNAGEDEGAKKQLQIIQSLIERQDVTGVISACDYDREGQIIGDIIIDHIMKQNQTRKVERLLLNEWTPAEVQSGLEKLIDNGNMTNLRDAGISRQWTDWTIGINLTSAATLKYQKGWTGGPLNIGRVLLPTLKIIYDRDKEIAEFVPEQYTKLTGYFETAEGGVYEGIYTQDGQERFPDKKAITQLRDLLKNKTGIIKEKKVEQKREYPPSLFNLSGLQGHVTSKFKGWTSEKVLKVAQDLYEKKYITYPRTASLALEESLKEKTAKVLQAVKKGLPYEKEIKFTDSKRIFDNAKVESHSAIMPTYILPKKLSPEEQIIYDSVKNRFIMQFMPVSEHEEGSLITVIQGEDIPEGEATFLTRGRIQKKRGWKIVENVQSKDKELPPVEEGDIVTSQDMKTETKSTSPPRKHTEKTLLRVMETCGKKYKENTAEEDKEETDIDTEAETDEETLMAILSGFSIGTPATRAETIKKLQTAGYIETKGKNLQTTDMGRKLVELFPVKELFDLEYTGRLEKQLSEIEKGNVNKGDFLQAIFDFTKQAVEKIKKDEFHVISQGEEVQAANIDGEVLGSCPGCGYPVVEKEQSFGCSNWRGGCKFVIWKTDKFLASLKVRPTKAVVISLLNKGAVYGNQFVSKKGNKFEACLTFEKNPDTGYYNWKLHFLNQGGQVEQKGSLKE